MRADPVAAARGWIGTPFVHQASSRGAGTDCLGLIRGLWRESLGAEPAPVPPYLPGEGDLLPALRACLPPGTGVPGAAGEILLFAIRPGRPALHLGIVSEPGVRFIHAWSGIGVVETRLSPPWARRVVASFGFVPLAFTKG